MYEYFVSGYITGLRTEIEYFFNQPTWLVSQIPDPQDADPERYAVLAVFPFYLVTAFNRLIERGLPRGSPAIILTNEVEEELRAREIRLEEEPQWASLVPRLEKSLVIPDQTGEEPVEEIRSQRCLKLNIIAEKPHVLFV